LQVLRQQEQKRVSANSLIVPVSTQRLPRFHTMRLQVVAVCRETTTRRLLSPP
jgi:hypothetical protein